MKTIEELKAYAYDCIANIEYWQAKSREANQAIAEYIAKEQEKQAEVTDPEKE